MIVHSIYAYAGSASFFETAPAAMGGVQASGGSSSQHNRVKPPVNATTGGMK
jgi:hypothetical protein